MSFCIALQISNMQANCALDDWQSIELMQVDEELEGYKKSGDKYLDKVDFLKRAELRQYEKERDQRLSQDMRSRGRLWSCLIVLNYRGQWDAGCVGMICKIDKVTSMGFEWVSDLTSCNGKRLIVYINGYKNIAPIQNCWKAQSAKHLMQDSSAGALLRSYMHDLQTLQAQEYTTEG